jgi:DNA replication protein DnaC
MLAVPSELEAPVVKPSPNSSIAPWLLQAVEWHPSLMGPLPLPEHMRECTLEMIPHKSLRKAVLRYGQDFWQLASKGIAPLFLGDPAQYKSYAAAAIAKALHERACLRVAWCDVPITLNQLERRRFEKATDERIEQWKQVPWLVMDDFAMVRLDSWQYGVLAEVALYRFDAGKPTCWTGNIDVVGEPTAQAVEDSLKRAVGTQLTRRILERSEGFRVYVR